MPNYKYPAESGIILQKIGQKAPAFKRGMNGLFTLLPLLLYAIVATWTINTNSTVSIWWSTT